MASIPATGPARPQAASTAATCATCNKSQAREGGKMLQCSGCKLVVYCSIECQKEAWPLHRAKCKRAQLPRILVLLSEKETLPLHQRVWKAASPSHANIDYTTSPGDALACLVYASSTNVPNGILICGDSLFTNSDPVYPKLRDAIRDFVLAKGGRVAVMGGSMSAGFDVLETFLHSMGVTWKPYQWWRTTYKYNPAFAAPNPPLTPATVAHLGRQKTRPSATPFPASWTMGASMLKKEDELSYYTKGSTLQDVPDDEAVFIPTPGAVASLSRTPVEKGVTSVAMKQVGTTDGWIGYVADTEMIDETVPIVLGMLGCDLKEGRSS